MLLVRRLERLDASLRAGNPDPAGVQATFARAAEYFLTQDGRPRNRLVHQKALFTSDAQWQTHRDLVVAFAPRLSDSLAAYTRDLNVLVSRGVLRMFKVAEAEYRRTLDAHAVLDFSDLLLRTLGLLRQMEEFSQSRYRLESRYHHVLVDEFQDTSRAQWELVALLVQSWGEGAGLAHAGPLPPSIFIVGDRKQSIYRFRDADVSVLQDAARHIDALRPEGDVRRSISRSFRSVPAILAFVNDICHDVEKACGRTDAFRYGEEDRFPVADAAPGPAEALGVVVADSPEACADSTAGEVARLLSSDATVRDVATGVPRRIRPGDVAIVFRTRESHREFEEALERRGVAAYVYKGLGFFDADEIRDVLALLWHLSDPASNLRAAAWLRSGFVRLSDEGLRLLGPDIAGAIASPSPPPASASLDAGDADALAFARRGHARWRALVDLLPPAELLDVVLSESAYAFELRGPRYRQARENLKKVRGLVRRAQNKGYATLSRIVAHLDSLAVGDEANASIDARDAVNLMTIHAAKGLEFPVVFIVNLTRGTGGRKAPIRVTAGSGDEEASVSVGSFQSQSDEDAAQLEREETKRLLYVALTRARDRVYLGAVARDGALQPATGSLSDVLPGTLLQVLSRARGCGSIAWTASSGVTHGFRVCGPASAAPSLAAQVSGEGTAEPTSLSGDDLQPLEVVVKTIEPRAAIVSASSSSSRLRGVMVHRIIQRFGLPAGSSTDEPALTERWQVEQLIRPDETDELDADEALITDAIAAYRSLAYHPEVVQLYGRGHALHEVPFLLTVDGLTVRGTIDCLVRSISVVSPVVGTEGPASEAVTVLEFKTGRASPEHETQLAIYRRAAEALFSGAIVDARLVYLNEPDPAAGESDLKAVESKQTHA
jgi:ATP-dependent exoDNAse (exonuclease V) beta subunit